jgi:hypothetical protein
LPCFPATGASRFLRALSATTKRLARIAGRFHFSEEIILKPRRPLANNRLRIRGVHQRKNGKGRYRAMIKYKHLGYFDTVEEAAAAYAKAANGEIA